MLLFVSCNLKHCSFASIPQMSLLNSMCWIVNAMWNEIWSPDVADCFGSLSPAWILFCLFWREILSGVLHEDSSWLSCTITCPKIHPQQVELLKVILPCSELFCSSILLCICFTFIMKFDRIFTGSLPSFVFKWKNSETLEFQPYFYYYYGKLLRKCKFSVIAIWSLKVKNFLF